VDLEVIAWLRRFRGATREEFESFLRELYNRPEMRRRFPRGF
jgi:transposase-like protein